MLRRLSILLLLLLLLSMLAAAQPAAGGTLWFLARYDANGDEVIDDDDPTGAFSLDLSDPSAIPVALHAPDERIQHLKVSADGTHAGMIVERDDGAYSAVWVAPDGFREAFALEGAESGLIESAGGRILWARADLGDSLALYAFDGTNAPGPHPLPRASIVYAVDQSDAYLSGYNIRDGTLALWRLDPFEALDTLALFAEPAAENAGNPAWSRVDSTLAVPQRIGDAFGVSLVRLSGDTPQHVFVPIETPPGTSGLTIAWSPAGSYVAVTPVIDDMQAALPLILIDTSAAEALVVSSPDAQNAVVAWAPDDSEVLINRTLAFGGEFDSRLLRYTPGTGQTTELSTVNGVVNVADAVWSPDGAHIALIGTTAFGNSLGVFTYERASEALDTLLTYSDNTLTLGRVFWSTDSRHLVFRARQDDALAQLTGATHALFLIDLATRETRQLTPDDISPLSNGIVIR